MKRQATLTRRQPKVRAPRGLSLAFKLIAEPDWTAHAAAAHAQDIYPHALRLVEGLIAGDDESGGQHRSDLVKAATKALHGHCWTDEEIATSPDLTGNTALYLGFATCWLLLMGVNGKGGAR